MMPQREPLSTGKPAEACECAGRGEGAPTAAGPCRVAKVSVHQYRGGGRKTASLADISALFGGAGSALTEFQRQRVTVARVADQSFACLDDRLTEPSFSTPGGDLGEFILALSSYLAEWGAVSGSGGAPPQPTQRLVDVFLDGYLKTLPPSRPLVHCTDERAVRHLEAELPMENLDLRAPPEHMRSRLLERLAGVENQGDSHIRLLLKQPELFHMNKELAPTVLRSFYRRLWQEPSKLRLQVLAGQPDPSAFVEVRSEELCEGPGYAPMLTPRSERRSFLVSHLDAVSLRRWELATFFAKVTNAFPHKVDRRRLHQRMDRHGWLALETTGSRIAAALPFYTLTYS